jgi:coenzyme Q-binding protein COQ10
MLAVLRRSLASHPVSTQQLQLLSVSLLPTLQNGLSSQLDTSLPSPITTLSSTRSSLLASSSPTNNVTQRSIFSLPGFEDDLAKKYTERKLLGYSPQQMYDVVASVEHYKDFVPWCQKSTVVFRKDDNTYLEAELEVGFQIFVEKYLSKVKLQPPTMITSHVGESTLFSHLNNSWKFQPGPTPQSVWMTFYVDFAFKSPLYRHVASLFFEEVVEKMMGAFEGRCRTLYGPSSLAKEYDQQRARRRRHGDEGAAAPQTQS